MKTQLIYISIFLFFQINLYSQKNIGGEPISFFNKTINSEIPTIKLAKQNNAKLIALAEEKLTYNKEQAWQFGKNIAITIDIKTQSVIDVLPNGKLYRLKIKSEDAKSLNIRFSNFKIPKKASLYIYNNSKTELLGAFTSDNNQKNGIFATGLINDDNLILEYFEETNSEFKGELIIDRVTHGFRTTYDYAKSFGNSGFCNINVACDDGTWENEIKSVCLLLTGGSAFCTGALINNTQEDGTPYILTADHCYRDPADMVFSFNWESTTCDNPINSPTHNDLSGAVLIAKNSSSDFCLLKMNDTPPFDYNVYYSGWDISDNASSKSVGIHHPSGDIKKISYDDNPSVSDLYMGNQGIDNSHWKVIWERGTTEGGSSGSPLYNENHQIIGQLHGGYASCNNTDKADWYGKFSYSWDYENDAEKRLKDWLNPTDLPVENILGYDPNNPTTNNDMQLVAINSPKKTYFEEIKITPSFKLRNRGIENITSFKISYKINNSNIKYKNWTGNLSTNEIVNIVFDEIKLNYGKYNLEVFVENPNGIEDEYKHNDTIKSNIIVYENIFSDDFENDNSWYLTGEFEIDNPHGLGGGTAYSDPTFATSGNNILGTDLTGLGEHKGDYEANIEDEEFAQSPVIDCRNFENTLLTFNRWLGTDKSAFDKVSIEYKTSDKWEKLWDNRNKKITDNEWKEQTFNISEIADGKKIIFRFNINETDHAQQYCGWNIDDFMVFGVRNDTILNEKREMQIYPNPSFGYFYIQINKIVRNANITVSDISGKEFYKKHFSLNEIKTIETSAYKKSIVKVELKNKTNGMVIISVKTDDNFYSDKIMYFSK